MAAYKCTWPKKDSKTTEYFQKSFPTLSCLHTLGNNLGIISADNEWGGIEKGAVVGSH